MNVSSILDYKVDPNEDYYGILGCDKTSSAEQILTEFKIRAKQCHPDKTVGTHESNPEQFQKLLKAKNTLTDPEERKYYDAWLDSGIAIPFKNWKGLKDTVKTSMHWATPKTERMIQECKEQAPVSYRTSNATSSSYSTSENPSSPEMSSDSACDKSIEETVVSGGKDQMAEDDEVQQDVVYVPTPYADLGYRVGSPVPEWKQERSDSVKKQTELSSKAQAAEKSETTPLSETVSASLASNPTIPATSTNQTDSGTAMRRKQFSTRRDSSIGAMVMTNKFDDNEIRRRFRNYEI